jgi:hypothetical protein
MGVSIANTVRTVIHMIEGLSGLRINSYENVNQSGCCIVKGLRQWNGFCKLI